MRIFAGGRAVGKTTLLILQSAQTGCRILVKTKQSADYLKAQAKSLGLVIPEPVVWDKGQQHIEEPVMIDNLEAFVQMVVSERLGTRVAIATTGSPIEHLDHPVPLPITQAEAATKARLIQTAVCGRWDDE